MEHGSVKGGQQWRTVQQAMFWNTTKSHHKKTIPGNKYKQHISLENQNKLKMHGKRSQTKE